MTKINLNEQWERFNKDIQKYVKENNFYLLGGTYYEMAEFLKKEGKDDSKLRDLGYKMKLKFQIKQLQGMKNSGIVKNVEIIACNDTCEICKMFNGKIFSIKEALLSNPLPVKNCSHPYGCRCVYGPSV